MITSSDSSSEDSDIEAVQKSPKEQMLESISLLADPFTKYSLTDREMFLSDLDSILKVISIEETIEYVIPALEIFHSE